MLKIMRIESGYYYYELVINADLVCFGEIMDSLKYGIAELLEEFSIQEIILCGPANMQRQHEDRSGSHKYFTDEEWQAVKSCGIKVSGLLG
jgi:hypothetical protein